MATENMTALSREWSNGNQRALDRLMPAVCSELRLVAAVHMRREWVNHTLQNAVVHGTLLNRVDQREVRWQNRAHFFAIVAQMIRRILVDHARAQRAARRVGDACTLAQDDALSALARMGESQARAVEMRFFRGLPVDETAEAPDISPATVRRDRVAARSWLFRELDRNGAARES